MRTVIDTTAHPGGGTMRYFQNIIPHLPDDGDDFIILIPKERSGAIGLRDGTVDRDNVSLREVPVGPDSLFLRVLFQQLILPWLLHRWNADVLFSPGDLTPLLAPCPVTLMIHNPNPYDNSLSSFSYQSRAKFALLRWMTAFSAWKARRIIFVSESSRETVLELLDIDLNKTTVIHHGVNRHNFSSTDVGRPNEIPEQIDQKEYILTVSTVLPHKNYETLLYAFDELLEKIEHDIHLVIVGRQPSLEYTEKLKRIVTAIGRNDAVHFLGGVSDTQLRALYIGSEIYVLPSKLETFGITILEAMASGVPVVAANASSLPEVGGDAAVYFQPNDPEDLAAVLVNLLTDTERRRALSDKGQARVQHFTWEQTAEQTMDVLRETAKVGSV